MDYRIYNRAFHNFSSYRLTVDEQRVLSLGVKFVPTPLNNHYTINDYTCAWNQFDRRARIKVFFDENDHETPPREVIEFRPKSDWIPEQGSIPNSVNLWLNNISKDFYNRFITAKAKGIRPKYNLSKNLRDAMFNLKNNENIVIKNADKNLGITVVDRNWYEQECLTFLNNNDNYSQISKGIVENTITFIKDIIISNTLAPPSHSLSKQTARRVSMCNDWIRLRCDDYTIPYFYILPKVHKPILAGRPITASHSWILSNFGIWFAYFLQPLIDRYQPVVKNTTDTIIQLDQLQRRCGAALFQSTRLLCITADVRSLYPSIPIDEKFFIYIKKWISERFQLGELHPEGFMLKCLSKKQIFKLAYTLFTQYIVSFSDGQYTKYFRQRNGIAMGTEPAPPIANLWMKEYEQDTISKFSRSGEICIYLRFIDDIFILWDTTKGDHNVFINTFNNLHPKIKYDWNVPGDRAEFLDLSISICSGKLIYNVHQKLLNKYLYIPWSSYHRRAQLKSFIIAELVRYRRLSSTAEGFLDMRKKFAVRLRARGYPPKVINIAFATVKYSDRYKDFVSKEKNKTPLVLTLKTHPVIEEAGLRAGLLKPPLTANKSIPTPLIAWSRSKNIGNIITKSGLE